MSSAEFEKKFTRILRRIRRYSPAFDEEMLRNAFNFSREAHRDQRRKSGEPYFAHCLEVANILSGLRMDHITISGALLHDVVEDTGITLEVVEQRFGAEVAGLVDGVTKISELKFESIEDRQAENFRKMLLSMVKDIRVIIIKFADRLHNMRTLDHLTENKQKRIALETREIYAPLAHRLGIARVRWELEDLALKALEPEAYWNLVKLISDRRGAREAYIKRFSAPIRQALKAASISASITGRPKHFYSVYKKMERRDKPFDEIYDLLAVRITAKKVEECYFALGIVHSHYTPIQERFKDYIATPKSNMYQSLHTTVIGHGGRTVEVQIRTEEMNRTAEVGVAAHWLYKEGKRKLDELDKQLAWLRQMLDWEHDTKDPKEFMENLRIDLFQDEVFVFTPKGDLIKLPLGSTPVDFAFAVHTDIGLHCLAAKVDGRIVPLNHKLKSGDSIEIITSANQKPSQDWIDFVRTSKARSRIKRWLKESRVAQSRKLGEEMLARELRKWRVKKDTFDIVEIAHTFGLSDAQQLYSAIGSGEISTHSIINKILPDSHRSSDENGIIRKFLSRARGSANGVRVQGLDNLMIQFGQCCQPVPGDKILGYITRGRGVTVHRADCKNVMKLTESPERHVDVSWDVEKDKRFLVRLRLIGEDRKNFLRDVSESISKTETNIVSIEMRAENSAVFSHIIVEVKNLQHLVQVMKRIGKVTGVLDVQRLDGTGEPIVGTEA